jgi:hypothetical protein
MPKGAEQKLQNRCGSYFSATAKAFGLTLDEKVQVLADITCLKDGDSFKLALGFAEVDLAFYLPVSLDESHWTGKSVFRLMRLAKGRRSTINIPFLIFELKRGGTTKRGITVDAIRSRTIVARRIKSLFPFCSYLFLADSTSKANETVLRHGKDFSGYFLYREEVTNKQLAAIDADFVRPHFQNLKRLGLFSHQTI